MTSGIYHKIYCTDNHYLADKRIAAESYEDTLAGTIVADLRTKYLDAEGITVGEIQDGPTIKQAVVNYRRVSEALDALAEKANFIWYIDEQKRLYFIDRATNAAPWTVTNLDIIRGTARLSKGNPLYRNRQYIRGGRAETDPQVENRTGDDETVAFAMGYPLAKVPTIKEDTVEKTVGIKGLNEDKDWYWSKGDPVVTADTAPAADVAIEVTYTGEFDIIVLAEDDAAILDRQGVEGGGTGYVDDIARDPNITTREAAFETAAKKLQKYATIGRKFTFRTHRTGLQPGQLQTVNYPLLNLNNAEMLIEVVKVRGEGKLLTYEVTAIEGPAMGGWSRLFQQLAERVMTIDRVFVGGEGTLDILRKESEGWGWKEAFPPPQLYLPAQDHQWIYTQLSIYIPVRRLNENS
ncbi:hypothetical protein ES708_05742 [subsurface metagenome]